MLDDDLPGLAAFGRQLDAAARRSAPRARRRWAPAGLATLLAVTGVSAVGAAAVLRASVIEPTRVAPTEQTPLAGSGTVLALRAADPAGGPAWALRLSRSRTGLRCTTVGQVRGDRFGIVGADGVFRVLPEGVVDACGAGETLVGARAVAAGGGVPERSVVYGAAGGAARSVTVTVRGRRRSLDLGPDGTFVTALVGAPADVALDVRVTFAGGRVEDHPLGVTPRTFPDGVGGPGWVLGRLGYGLPAQRRRPPYDDYLRCGQLVSLRQPDVNGRPVARKTPTACMVDSSGRRWVADARVLRAGDGGVRGFDRWIWGRHAARTVVWGIGRGGDSVRSVTLTGAGAPRRLPVSPESVFGAVLAPSVDPARLRLTVRFSDGRVERGRPGVGLTPDTVPSRRYR